MRKQSNLTVDVTKEAKEEEVDSGLSTPRTPDEDINFDYVYALYRFEATLEGQVTVQRDEPLLLLEDTNSYWWLVRPVGQEGIGYIPAENIETPNERLARLNRHRNVKNLLPNAEEAYEKKKSDRPTSARGGVGFSTNIATVLEYEQLTSEDESDIEDYPEQDQSEEEEIEDSNDRYQGSESNGRKRRSVESILSASDITDSDGEGPSFLSGGYGGGVTMDDFLDDYSGIKQNYDETEDNMLSPYAAEHPSAVLLRVYTGNVPIETSYKTVVATDKTTAQSMIKQAVKRFRLDPSSSLKYYLTILTPGAEEYKLGNEDYPIAVLELIQSQRNSVVSNASARSSSSSLNHLIQSMGLERENVFDHTNHDSVFRFYLHLEQPEQSSQVQRRGRISKIMDEKRQSRPVYIKVIAFIEAGNEDNRQFKLAKDSHTARDFMQYVPVDVMTDMATLVSIAVQELEIVTNEKLINISVIHNGKESVPESNSKVVDFYQNDDDDLFFLLRHTSYSEEKARTPRRLTARYDMKAGEAMPVSPTTKIPIPTIKLDLDNSTRDVEKRGKRQSVSRRRISNNGIMLDMEDFYGEYTYFDEDEDDENEDGYTSYSDEFSEDQRPLDKIANLIMHDNASKTDSDPDSRIHSPSLQPIIQEGSYSDDRQSIYTRRNIPHEMQIVVPTPSGPRTSPPHGHSASPPSSKKSDSATSNARTSPIAVISVPPPEFAPPEHPPPSPLPKPTEAGESKNIRATVRSVIGSISPPASQPPSAKVEEPKQDYRDSYSTTASIASLMNRSSIRMDDLPELPTPIPAAPMPTIKSNKRNTGRAEAQQLARIGFFEAGGLSDLMAITSAQKADADIEEQAQRASNEILGLFEAQLRRLNELDQVYFSTNFQRLEYLIARTKTIF